jgi:hypothetical protein
MDIALFGLLHLAEGQFSAVNVRTTSFDQQRSIYLKNAVALSRSLLSRGLSFTLLTNRKEELVAELERTEEGNALSVESIDFHTDVRSGMKFYSAHFKLDVFSYLSRLEQNRYVGLLDLDMIALNQIPNALANMVERGIPAFYDISDTIIPVSHHEIMHQMDCISPGIVEGRWAGGELLLGRPSFFGALGEEINAILSRYTELAETLFHQGDEVLTSIAIDRLRARGLHVVDAGTLGIVGRFWSWPVPHAQKPFRYYKSCFLLHLPGDKKFLSRLEPEQCLSRTAFLRCYRSHLLANRLKAVVVAPARRNMVRNALDSLRN